MDVRRLVNACCCSDESSQTMSDAAHPTPFTHLAVLGPEVEVGYLYEDVHMSSSPLPFYSAPSEIKCPLSDIEWSETAQPNVSEFACREVLPEPPSARGTQQPASASCHALTDVFENHASLNLAESLFEQSSEVVVSPYVGDLDCNQRQTFNDNESGTGSRLQLVVVWDAENVPIGRQGRNFKATALVDCFVACAGKVPHNGWGSAAAFYAKGGIVRVKLVLHQNEGNPWHFGQHEREALIDAGVTIIDPGMKKGAVDTKVKELLREVEKREKPANTAVLLLGGDRDFAPEVRSLRERGFQHLVLLHNGDARPSFCELFAAHDGKWEEKRKFVGLGKLPVPRAKRHDSSHGSRQSQICWQHKAGRCSKGKRCKWVHESMEPLHETMQTESITVHQCDKLATVMPASMCETAQRDHSSWRENSHRCERKSSCLLKVMLALLIFCITALSIWRFNDHYAQTAAIASHVIDAKCRLRRPVYQSAPMRPLVLNITVLGRALVFPIPGSTLPFIPITRCWVDAEVWQPCAHSNIKACWQQFGNAFTGAGNLTLLTFAYTNRLCSSLVPEYFALARGFNCSCASENFGRWGILANRQDDWANLWLVEVIQVAGKDDIFRTFIIALCCLVASGICLTVWECVFLLLRFLHSRICFRCLPQHVVRHSPTASAPTVVIQNRKNRNRQPRVLANEHLPRLSSQCIQRVKRADRAFFLSLVVVASAGLAWLAGRYEWSIQILVQFNRNTCRISKHEGENTNRWQGGQVSINNRTWDLPVLDSVWTSAEMSSCRVKLEVAEPCEYRHRGTCWRQFGRGFRDKAGRTLLTTTIFPKFTNCRDFVSQKLQASSNFSCLYPSGNFGEWGVSVSDDFEAINFCIINIFKSGGAFKILIMWIGASFVLLGYLIAHSLSAAVVVLRRFIMKVVGQQAYATVTHKPRANSTPLWRGSLTSQLLTEEIHPYS